MEAAYGKNNMRGAKLASAFQLMYLRTPLLSGKQSPQTRSLPSVRDNNAVTVRRKISDMLRSQTRRTPTINVGDEVCFWRDGLDWLGPATTVPVGEHSISILHNGNLKSASSNRVRKIEAPPDSSSCEKEAESPVETSNKPLHGLLEASEDDSSDNGYATGNDTDVTPDNT